MLPVSWLPPQFNCVSAVLADRLGMLPVSWLPPQFNCVSAVSAITAFGTSIVNGEVNPCAIRSVVTLFAVCVYVTPFAPT